MSIKNFVKTHCPRALLPMILKFYRSVKFRLIRSKVQKYLPYYQDQLSRDILSDCLEYIRTRDVNPFIDRAEKEGWKFSELLSIDSSLSDAKVIVVYDKEGRDMDYTRKLLTMLYGSDGFRCMKLKDFLTHNRFIGSSIIVPVVNGRIPISCREKEQYFDVFSPVDDEIVVDAGAYDGATALQFLEWGKGKVKRVYSFEFDPENAAKCEENLKPYSDKVTLVKKGTWDKVEVMHVDAAGGAGSSVSTKGSTAVYLTSIDSVVQDERVTFIKMDVEGAELKSLMGAKNTIIKNHPRLAICAYHKSSDLYELPEYILSLVPEYKFYLRHYSSCGYETVLYAYCG